LAATAEYTKVRLITSHCNLSYYAKVATFQPSLCLITPGAKLLGKSMMSTMAIQHNHQQTSYPSVHQ